MQRTTSFLLATLGLAAPCLGQTTGIRYEVVDLGLTSNASTVCPCFFNNAINEHGDAAGFFFGTDGSYNAFRASGGLIADISPPGDNTTFARGINDAGWVVGWTNAFALQHAFLHDGATLLDLGTLGGTYSDAHDVNNAGRVAGSASTPYPEDDTHAAVWEGGSWTDLGTLDDAPFSDALAVNESGLIVGWSWNAAWDSRAVYWTSDLDGPFELASFSPPDRITSASGVNDAGLIVGRIEIEPFEGFSRYRAVLWQDGTPIDLGLLPEAGHGESAYFQTAHVSTAAHDINNAGVIVGESFPPAATPQLRPGPFVRKDGVMRNLNDLLAGGDWIVTSASSVNDAGVIGASARTLDDHHSRAVLLVPVEVVLGDLDGSGAVGFGDLLIMLTSWGPCIGCSASGDLDANGAVDFGDLLVLLGNWGAEA